VINEFAHFCTSFCGCLTKEDMKKTMVIGATINALAILAGGSIGLLLKGRASDRVSQGIMKALGLCIVIIGIRGGLGGDVMLIVVSLALGALVGELVGIDDLLQNFGQWVQAKFSKGDEKSTFAEGFVTASLLFCVGAMAVVGSIDSGLRDDQSVIITKSIIDAMTSVILASTFGAGVLLSAFMVFVYQGIIEFFAGNLQHVLTASLIAQISAVGGVMILGLGANIAFGAKIKVANLLPSFVFAGLYYFIIIA